MHRTISAFLPGMLAQGQGSIVNVASVVAATKAAPNRYVHAVRVCAEVPRSYGRNAPWVCTKIA